jgi:hypothetical protein
MLIAVIVLVVPRMTPEQEAAYSLDYGVARDDLSEQAKLAYDRLVAQPAGQRADAKAEPPPGQDPPWWVQRLRLAWMPDPRWPVPSWASVTRGTLIGSLIGVIVAFAAIWARSPNWIPVLPGAGAAAWLLWRRWIRIWVIVVSALVAGVLAALVWWPFYSAHVVLWSLAANAGVCPIAGVSVARLLTLIRPVTLVARPQVSPATMAQLGQLYRGSRIRSPVLPPGDPGELPSPQSDPGEPPPPPLPADLI